MSRDRHKPSGSDVQKSAGLAFGFQAIRQPSSNCPSFKTGKEHGCKQFSPMKKIIANTILPSKSEEPMPCQTSSYGSRDYSHRWGIAGVSMSRSSLPKSQVRPCPRAARAVP
ncbi:hypothetical protein CEXT_343861 [Caerostris extrusa]|uniref:Uncharacterized protein n=1 Tax=Caerostris extrusa TaxID=172846 RepID=A0AAV4UUU6_CAEEX|nr:hypothetical protein CEXT_343861 [Caerostris extrusa]